MIVSSKQTTAFFPRATINDESNSSDEKHEPGSVGATIQKINYNGSGKSNSNRYALQFYRESDQQLKQMKDESRKAYTRVSLRELEIGNTFFSEYDFPKRPQWTYAMSKEQLDRNENKSFTHYVMKMERHHADENKILSYFELNLETWRQLWRVLEISDIVLIIVDIRYPVC